jgi:hypothetical protein
MFAVMLMIIPLTKDFVTSEQNGPGSTEAAPGRQNTAPEACSGAVFCGLKLS